MPVATLEVDHRLIFEELDGKRQHEGMSPGDVERLLGMRHPAYHSWRTGGGFSPNALVRVLAWLGKDLDDFTRGGP